MRGDATGTMTTATLMLLCVAPGHALLAGVTSGRLWPRFGPKMAVLPPYNSGITPIEIQIIQREESKRTTQARTHPNVVGQMLSAGNT